MCIHLHYAYAQASASASASQTPQIHSIQSFWRASVQSTHLSIYFYSKSSMLSLLCQLTNQAFCFSIRTQYNKLLLLSNPPAFLWSDLLFSCCHFITDFMKCFTAKIYISDDRHFLYIFFFENIVLNKIVFVSKINRLKNPAEAFSIVCFIFLCKYSKHFLWITSVFSVYRWPLKYPSFVFCS